jgi:hypothetical protein
MVANPEVRRVGGKTSTLSVNLGTEKIGVRRHILCGYRGRMESAGIDLTGAVRAGTRTRRNE